MTRGIIFVSDISVIKNESVFAQKITVLAI